MRVCGGQFKNNLIFDVHSVKVGAWKSGLSSSTSQSDKFDKQMKTFLESDLCECVKDRIIWE